MLLLAQLAFPPSDLWELFPVVAPWAQPLVYFLSGGVIAAVVGMLRPLLARDPRVRFWMLGTALAVLPACSQVVSDRLLLFTGLGAHAAIARLFLAFLDREEWTASGGRLRVLGTKLGVGVLVLFHVVIATAWLPLRARGAADVRNFLARGERTVPSSPDVTGKTVVLLNPPADAFPGYLPMKRATEGVPRPGRLRWLATGSSDLHIERLDEITLRVRAAAGFQLLASERMQRSPRHPMPVGFKVELPAMTVLVTDVMPDGRPAEIVARFDLPLEDDHMVLLQWSDDRNGFVPFPAPKIGDAVDVPRLDYTKLKI